MTLREFRKLTQHLPDDVLVLRVSDEGPGYDDTSAELVLVCGGPAGYQRQSSNKPFSGKQAVVLR